MSLFVIILLYFLQFKKYQVSLQLNTGTSTYIKNMYVDAIVNYYNKVVLQRVFIEKVYISRFEFFTGKYFFFKFYENVLPTKYLGFRTSSYFYLLSFAIDSLF